MITAVQKAKTSQSIAKETDEKIRALISWICILLGFRIPEKADGIVLTTYIRDNLQKYSAEDFKISFELYVKGRLDVADTRQLSAYFISRVLNEYDKKYRFEYKGEEEKPLSKEEQDKIIRDGIVDLWQRYKSGGDFNVYEFSDIKHDYLYKKGVIGLAEGDYKKELIRKAKEQWEYDITQDLYRAEMNGYMTAVKYFRDLLKKKDDYFGNYMGRGTIKRIAKGIKLKDYFDKLKGEGGELEI